MTEAEPIDVGGLAYAPRQLRFKRLPGGTVESSKVAVTFRQKQQEIAFGFAIDSATDKGYEIQASNLGILIDEAVKINSVRLSVMERQSRGN